MTRLPAVNPNAASNATPPAAEIMTPEQQMFKGMPAATQGPMSASEFMQKLQYTQWMQNIFMSGTQVKNEEDWTSNVGISEFEEW